MTRKLPHILLMTLTLFFACSEAFAQTTKVRGKVIDVLTNEGVPFASVFFEDSTVGITADENGCYSLETRDMSCIKLKATMLSYTTQTTEVEAGKFNNIDFYLVPLVRELSKAVIKADDSKARRMLDSINFHRNSNNPEAKAFFSCRTYNKMELDLANAQKQLAGKKWVEKDIGFIFDYMDTSSISGIPYLPVMISESITERSHTSSPLLDREDIISNQISGINPENNLLSQFTATMKFKNNFYREYISFFQAQMPSPINTNALLYYNYYIVDSLVLDGRKNYVVRYHPKPAISSPAFDGELLIDAEDYALRRVHARLSEESRINWLRDIVLDCDFKRDENGEWFFDTEKLYMDFSITYRDSSDWLAFLGNRSIIYTSHSFEQPENVESIMSAPVRVIADTASHSSEYWDSVRPYELSQKEKNVYSMVSRIQDTKLYRNSYDVAFMVINGYWDFGYVSVGHYLKALGYNNMEGFRLQANVRTSKKLSTTNRGTVYLAYGFKDNVVKGGATYEHIFSREPMLKLTAEAKYDKYQLGRGTSKYTFDNLLASIATAWDASKLCMMTDFLVQYDHEINPSVNLSADIRERRYYANEFIPMVSPQGSVFPSVAMNQLHLQGRFSKDETVSRLYYEKKYLRTAWPVITLDLYGSVSGIRKYDCGYFRPELSIDYKNNLPPIGQLRLHLNGGYIFGKVPYPMLHLHEGNASFLHDKTAFDCMEYMEFASDAWCTFFLDHDFHGLLFGRIPGIKKLDLREVFTFKLAWGALSEKNDGSLGRDSQALMLFPEGTKALGDMPYMEIGCGITNILRIIRVDFAWRLTHRYTVQSDGSYLYAPRLFTVKVGLEFKF